MFIQKIKKLLNGSSSKELEKAKAAQTDLSERGKTSQLSEDDQKKNTEDLIKSYHDLWNLRLVKEGKCLDVGAYHGYMWDFSPDNFEIYGLNIVDEDHQIALDRVKQFSHVKETEIGSMEDIPYADNFFDIVYCKQTLEHSYDLGLALREMKRVLKPGGNLLIEVPINLGFDPAHTADIEGTPDEKEEYWIANISEYFTVGVAKREEYFFCMALQVLATK